MPRFRTCALPFACLVAASGAAFAQQLPFRTFPPGLGAPRDQVWDLAEDADGRLWIATSVGLARFDGRSFGRVGSADGLSDPAVRTLVFDSSGTLWLGTGDGLVRFDGRTLEHFGEAEGVRGGAVWAVARDRRDRIWFGTGDGGLGVIAGGRARMIPLGGPPGPPNLYSLLVDSRERLWIGDRRPGVGLRRCDLEPTGPVRCRVFTAGGLSEHPIHALAEGMPGELFVGLLGGGVARIDAATGAVRERFLAGARVYDLVSRRDGSLAVATLDDGLALCHGRGPPRCQTVHRRNGLGSNGVLSVFEDSEGSLWIGLSNGLGQLLPEPVSSYGVAEGLPGPRVFAVLAEPAATWAGTSGGLARISRSGPDGRPAIETWGRESLPGIEVWDVHRDRGGNLWLGTGQGLCLFDPDSGTCTKPSGDLELADSSVLDLLEAADGALWIGGVGGIGRIRNGNPPEVASFGIAEGLPGTQVHSLVEDRAGRIWASCYGKGLAVISGAEVRSFTPAAGLPTGSVYSLALGPEGHLWVGTAGSGFSFG